ncbi:hypothetical protein [Leucobacter sp. NPDC077196]|uniref:hypothetical protein n=1 Tax=Leucobacter sp. NPDC077196 TaxID=3154959 RepID=UPI0034299270
MSVKSERRAWYAANVEPRPELRADSPEYLAWVQRANAYMVARCVPGTAILQDPAAVAAPSRVAAKSLRASGTDDADRAAYRSLIEAMQYRIADHMGWPGTLWDDFWRQQAFGADARRRPSLEFCKGSLHIAWPHLTEEMQRAHDAGVWRWVTFAEFKAEQVAERAAMAEAYAAEATEVAAEDVWSEIF